ncbi:MAG: 2'-deoxycytidine 5'-triphosphate deaminase [Nitrospinota bacterium]
MIRDTADSVVLPVWVPCMVQNFSKSTKRDWTVPRTKSLEKAEMSVPEGVLPRQEIMKLVNNRHIWSDFTIKDQQFQPASLDLRLGEKAHRVQCSFLPGKRTVESRLSDSTIHALSLGVDGAVLEPGLVYIIPLMERFSLPEGIRARANPRSSTGRLDIFTRVITNYSDHFDEIQDTYEGPLFLEFLSRSFPVRITRGLSLTQVRFIRGNCRCTDEDIIDLHERGEVLLYDESESVQIGEIMLREGLFLRVDLRGICGTRCVGYKAKKHRRLIDLERVKYYRILDFWEPVYREKDGKIILEKDDFYLLTSKEKVSIPRNYAAEMVAYEQTSGELRTHYAGFFDPGFGYGPEGNVKGTVAVMEVRALDAPFMVEDGQRFCKLQLEKMAETPDVIYGAKEIGSAYQFQGLTPSKHFVPLEIEIEEIKKHERIEQLTFA